ncbi:MAG: hypothetical protein HZA08_02715 [Nitrospirae bacterium]|nr:hypothetical protein [Nitrospirota bacterium]
MNRNKLQFHRYILFSILLPMLVLAGYAVSHAALNENCTVSVLNRTAQVKPDGSWVIPNVPSNMGKVRVRATCVENGVTRSGQSDWVIIPPNGSITVGDIPLDVFDPVPSAVSIASPSTPDKILNPIGTTAQLVVTATYPDGSTKNITLGSKGTVYGTTNVNIATVSDNGLVTATGTGKVIISASNEMVLSSMMFTVINTTGNNDVDNDGIPDDWELANGLNPNDPIDAMEDADHDGLTNKQEYDNGTMLRVADSDGDGINDGEELKPGTDGYITNPLLADSDGDGIRDGLEVRTGSDPNDSGNYNLAQALSRLEVTPSNFVLIFNTIMSEASRQLTVTGILTDGTRLDLTSNSRGTNYNSSDLAVANFGATDGLVFAGQNGVALITVSNSRLDSRFNVVSRATVRTFSPTALSYLNIPAPGFANNVDVSGDHAYVAGGSGGLYVADISNPSSPVLRGSVDTPGNANDVRVVGNLVYVADGASGLQIVDATNPAVPVIIGSANTPGDAWDVVVNGNYAYIADGSSGLQIINISNPALPTIVGSLDTPGTAKGVDVSGNIAVVADSTSGIRVIDVSDPAHPVSVGSVSNGSDAVDLAISGSTAYEVQYTNGLRSVDINNPSAPAEIGNETVGGYLFDIATWGNFAFSADVLRVNAVPIHDITTPSTPLFRAVLDFSGYRDDNGTGIAVTPNYLYLTAGRDILENGTTGWWDGYTRLYIGQYAEIVDSGSTPPTVSITSPANNAEVIEGSTLPVTVLATDDVMVASVNILVDGNIVSTDNASPFQFNYQVPVGITSLAIGATGIDLANNTGTAPNVFISVLPDPPPTVSISSPANGDHIFEGSVLAISADATDNTGVTKVDFLVDGLVVGTDTTSPYQVLYTVPVGSTGLILSARGTDTLGKVGASAEVSVIVDLNPAPTAGITSPLSGDTVIEGSTVSITVDATDNDTVASVDVLVDGIVVGTAMSSPFHVSFRIPTGVTSLTIGATATDNLGKTGNASDITVNVIPDPGTTVIGRVVDNLGVPISGANVSTLGGLTAVTDINGTFSISGVPTVQGNIIVSASATINGANLIGSSASVQSVPSGTTDVGDVVIVEAYFETQLGSNLIQSDDTYLYVAFPTGFTFPFYGQNYTDVYVSSNGRLTFNYGSSTYSENLQSFYNQPNIASFFDDLDSRGGVGGDGYNTGVYVNDALPGKMVFTWWKNPHYYYSNYFNSPNTIQVILYQDGRITIGYKEIMSSFGTMVGISPGNDVNSISTDFTLDYPFNAQGAVYELFGTMDLADKFIMFTPNALIGGYDVNVVGATRTTVTGLVVDDIGNPVSGANVTIGIKTTTTGTDGRFSMNLEPAGDITVNVFAFIGGLYYSGSSAAITPVNNGTTDAGTIVISPPVLNQVINETFGTGFNSGQWFFGGSAAQDSTNENLLIAPVTGGYGRAFYLTPFMADSFHAEFDYNIYGGDGADGLTFAWVNDYNYQETGGGSLNFDGANGFAVEFDTWPGNSGDTGSRHIGVLQNYTSNHLATFDTETRGTHHVSINFSHGHIQVLFDGAEVINHIISNYIPFNAYFGFTAATGGSTDNHVIDNFILNTGGMVN